MTEIVKIMYDNPIVTLILASIIGGTVVGCFRAIFGYCSCEDDDPLDE